MSTTTSIQEGYVPSTAFGNLAERYEKSTAGAHNIIASKLMTLSPPFTEESRILDNATGTGVVVEELQLYLSSKMPNSNLKIPIIAADAAKPMIQYLNAKIARMNAANQFPNLEPIETHIVRAEELNANIVPDNSITHAYMNFGIFFCSDPILAASNMYRSLVPGGTALITTWYDLSFMIPVWQAHQAQYPEQPQFKVPFSEDWQDRGFVEDALVKSGFERDNIQVFKEDTYMTAPNVETMAANRTDLLTTLVKGPNGWESQTARDEFTARLVDILLNFEGFKDHGEKGVTLKMLANIWVCTK